MTGMDFSQELEATSFKHLKSIGVHFLSFFSKDDFSFAVSTIALFLLFGQNCGALTHRHKGTRDLVLSFRKQSKEGKMDSCSTLPTVIILTSVGLGVKRITLPPTDGPNKNTGKNTALYLLKEKKKENLELTELQMKCLEVLKMWAGFSALHCKGRARMWSGVTPERTNLALSTNIQGVLQYVFIFLSTVNKVCVRVNGELRNRERDICHVRIYSLIKDISKM